MQEEFKCAELALCLCVRAPMQACQRSVKASTLHLTSGATVRTTQCLPCFWRHTVFQISKIPLLKTQCLRAPTARTKKKCMTAFSFKKNLPFFSDQASLSWAQSTKPLSEQSNIGAFPWQCDGSFEQPIINTFLDFGLFF